MVKSTKYLDENYPKEERCKLIYIELAGKNLEGHLDLSDFVNLKNLWCSNNQIISLDISENKELQKIILSNNRITANLDIFSHLTKLGWLDIGSYGKEEKTNDFVGSLKSLRNCSWLLELHISYNEKIIGGLEYLPNSVDNFSCKETIFCGMVDDFGFDWHGNFIIWKIVNHPDQATDSPEKLVELIDYRIERVNVYLKGFYDGWRKNDKVQVVLEDSLKSLNDCKEKAVLAFSHKMVERIISEHKELKSRVQELENQLEQVMLETKIEILPKSGN